MTFISEKDKDIYRDKLRMKIEKYGVYFSDFVLDICFDIVNDYETNFLSDLIAIRRQYDKDENKL